MKENAHPFEFVPAGIRKTVLILFLALALICMVVFMFILDPPLRTALSPLGIISFELAWTVPAVSAILGGWDYVASLHAAFGLGFDFLFMLGYGLAIGLGTLLASRRMGKRFSELGKWLGWGVIAAVLFDIIENILLFVIMTRGNYPPYALFASLAASLKFVFILLGIVYSLMGLFVRQQPRSGIKKPHSRKARKSVKYSPTTIEEDERTYR